MLAPMQFEWDEAKSRANLKKHGLDFELAAEAFADPYRITARSDGSYEEERWMTIALVRNGELVVIYTERGESTRIISARKAERYERERYWKSRV